jgi:undecaprenyl-diphosphatase
MRSLEPLLRWIGRHVRGFRAAIGVYLAIGLGISVAALLGFGALSYLVTAGATHAADESILLWMHEHSTPRLDSWARKLTPLGSSVVAVMVVLVASGFLWTWRQRWSLLLLWVAMLGSAVLNVTLKWAFSRPRPELWDRMHAGDSSFPSGHAMTAVVIYGTIAFLLARLEEGRRIRRLTLGIAALTILLTGATRVYLGVHYPSDVVAGYLVALVWATFCALGVEAVRYFRGRRPEVAEEERGLNRGMEPVRDALRPDG